jgi:diacylglycerol O-acyltransferase / wax synthase
MNATDSLMWRVEADPLLRSTVTAVSVLDRPPDWDELRRRLAVAVREVPRLTQRVRTHLPIGSPRWEDDPNFDLSYHLRRLRLQDATFDSVLAIAAASAMGGFDRSRPPWEFVVFEGLDDGRAVLVQKFHHSMTDGVGGLRLAALLFDLERDPTRPTGDEKPSGVASAEGRETSRTGPSSRLSSLPASAASALVSLPRAIGGAAFRASRSPLKTVSAVVDASRWGARLLAPVSAPLSPVLRGRSTSLHFEAFDVDLATVRAAARGAGCKVNDVFLAAVVGGLARYHAKNGVHVDALRMTLPISIRTDSDPLGSNRITLVRFKVPCGDSDARSRLSQLSEIVAAWRGGPALRITDLLARGLNALPGPAVSAVFGQMLKNVDFVATNVPGFPVPFYVAGAEVVRLYAFAPTCGSALNVSLVSHVGRCCIGVSADPAAVSDTSLLVRCLQSGFDEVLAVAADCGGATETSSPLL